MQKPLAFTSLAALFVAVLVCARASAAFVPPSGLAPGSQYQLIFDTADNIDGSSADVATYNSFAVAEAALNPQLPQTTWAAIVSTLDIDANVNAPALGLPVYNTQGIKVADAVNGLYSGSLLDTVRFDQFGIAKDITTGRLPFVWTGSTPNGVADGPAAMGAFTFSTYGLSVYSDPAWISQGPLNILDPGGVYALSGPLTVPEPNGALLLCLGGLAVIRKRR